MENKINIVEILKDCPSGMELDCTLLEGLEFDSIVDNEYLPIRCRVKNPNGGYNVYNFTKYGCWFDTTFAKCVIFPKGKTTWEGFQRPFKDGDIIYACDEYSDATFTYVAILKQIEKGEKIQSHCFYNFEDDYFSALDFLYDGYNTRFATEEEKKKLFDAIKDNGYKWNADTKTLEKLIKPKFKVGDKIVKKNSVCVPFVITGVSDAYYSSKTDKYVKILPVVDQDDWELFTNKFDTNTLKPFESRVLVRDYDHQCWGVSFFGYFDKFMGKFDTVRGVYIQCIPYEGNEHLLNTNKNCDEYYKNW
jgi:hypothetical protein